MSKERPNENTIHTVDVLKAIICAQEDTIEEKDRQILYLRNELRKLRDAKNNNTHKKKYVKPTILIIKEEEISHPCELSCSGFWRL